MSRKYHIGKIFPILNRCPSGHQWPPNRRLLCCHVSTCDSRGRGEHGNTHHWKVNDTIFPHMQWALNLVQNQELLLSNVTFFYKWSKEKAYPSKAKGQFDPGNQCGVLIIYMSYSSLCKLEGKSSVVTIVSKQTALSLAQQLQHMDQSFRQPPHPRNLGTAFSQSLSCQFWLSLSHHFAIRQNQISGGYGENVYRGYWRILGRIYI